MRYIFCTPFIKGTAFLIFSSGLLLANSDKLSPTSGSVQQVDQSTVLSVQLSNEPMTISKLEMILQEEGRDVNVQENVWQFTLEGRELVVLVNEENDRLRIIAPIISVNQLTGQQVQNILIANYHTALDARYAITDSTLVSVFVHPFRSLQENDLRSALYQVSRLATNFGTTYSSGDLILQPNAPDQQPRREQNSIEEGIQI